MSLYRQGPRGGRHQRAFPVTGQIVNVVGSVGQGMIEDIVIRRDFHNEKTNFPQIFIDGITVTVIMEYNIVVVFLIQAY